MAPGLSRERFGFERWASHDDTLRARVRDLRTQAKEAARREGPEVRASDLDPRALSWLQENARAAGVTVITETRDVRDLEALPSASFVVTNPPYGERIAADRRLYDGFADALRRLRPNGCAVLAGTPAIGAAIGRDPSRFWILFNGPIECRLMVYEMAS